MNTLTKDDQRCDYLLFVATDDEEEALRHAAADLGLPFDPHEGDAATYFDLGEPGGGRVLAARTAIGPFSFFGDGFFNSVLYQELHEGELAKTVLVTEAIAHVRQYSPYKEGKAYGRGLTAIQSILKESAQTLVRDLNYSESTATEILAGAVAYYLDERFSITNRKRLGFQ